MASSGHLQRCSDSDMANKSFSLDKDATLGQRIFDLVNIATQFVTTVRVPKLRQIGQDPQPPANFNFNRHGEDYFPFRLLLWLGPFVRAGSVILSWSSWSHPGQD
eukprot:scaffold9360_cov120-Skeletonema_dohrnii-CCMP3373.AAC.3